jgi:hypothetical protein
MTYHTPELLLVGAAQNLVLCLSPLVRKEAGICERELALEMPEYQSVDNW